MATRAAFVAVLFLFAIGAPVRAQDSAATTRKSVFLYEIGKNSSSRADGALLPERVYVKYEPDWKHWILVMTDAQGHIPTPTRALFAGSVLSGARLGGSAETRYKLTLQTEWVATSEPEHYWFWVNDALPAIEHVTFPNR